MFSDATSKLIQNLTGYLNVLASAGKLAQSDVQIITKAVSDIGNAAYEDGKRKGSVGSSGGSGGSSGGTDKTSPTLYITLRDSDAQGYVMANGHFILMAGGDISPLEPTATCPSSTLNKLEAEKDKLDGTKILKDIEFKSSSGAACFVLKASANGNDVWKTADGVRLGDIGKPGIIPKKKKLTSSIGPLYCTGGGASAIGYLRHDGVFVLQAGSLITAEEPTKACPSGALKRLTAEAENLRENEVLADLEFGSASAAGNFVLKSSANGNDVWATEDGVKLGELK